ncbi:23S rRNA (adenine(2030)-N(6))-methyltransferase RlmJ [Pseudooceanicola sp. 502str34]|uniref:23S rRNA (adenine(2030)-N(6))-methyltransferase RlmJ n=1 Tax=Maritimibacter alkaliphilus TaxID=404236 RepID=UPI001C971257|nr:23S rRNA (adenine(2030)-N(6))-methyltransferase RlmJ [Maritimibacter alkaliphilus]MBY6088999.1 23S rRNA (adenine(2030)-N(6))-methyltransferase RlmJ [Maritimibacter alkaliphilus]
MLSYQHAYHAGNPADVHKHALLASVLSYLCGKDKPLTYMETHSGRALYRLDGAEALKTGEAAQGVGRLLDALPADHPYLRALAAVRAAEGPEAYPGSPRIAAEFLRPDDRMHLAELHPQEFEALREAMKGRGAKLHRQDGFEMALSVAPPEPRRGLLLIDPSWEVKSDYTSLPIFLSKLHRIWNVGVVLLWYPILRDAVHLPMLRAIEAQDFPGAIRHEVRFPPVREGHRMVGSGMYVINAPWGTEAALKDIDRLF